MKRPSSILLHLLILLALCACSTVPASPSPMPSPTPTTQPSRLPDPREEVGSCSSGEVAAPEVVEAWSPPAEAASITPLSCDEIGEVFAYDPQAPLDIQEVGRTPEEGVTLIDLTYASPMGGRVPATLVVPDGVGPFAGMIYMHGMVDTRQTYIRAAATYARMGAVVLLIDAPYTRRPTWKTHPLNYTEQDRREQIQLIVDLRRGIDLLLSRPEVDPERLAYVGYSYGGAMGGLLAGVEDRLKAYVLQVGDAGLVTHMATGPKFRDTWLARPEEERRQWVEWMWPIEPIHYVGCASPAALLFQNGTLDIYVAPADGLRYQEAGSEPKTVRWYRVGHMLSMDGAAFQDQAEWLRQRIGISVGRLAVPVDPQVLAAYAGRYQYPNGIVTICVDGTRIFLHVPNEPNLVEIAGDFELLAVSEDHFHLGVSNSEIAFRRNDSGEVDRMVMAVEGKPLGEWARVP